MGIRGTSSDRSSGSPPGWTKTIIFKPLYGWKSERYRLSALLIGILALMASGCGIVDGITAERNTAGILLAAGFPTAKVTFQPSRPSSANQPEILTVLLSPMSTSPTGGSAPLVTQQYTTATNLVWTTFPYAFNSLSITITGSPANTYSFSQLQFIYGPRPSKLSPETISKIVYAAWTYVYYAGYALIGLIALIFGWSLYSQKRRKVAKVSPSLGRYGGWHHEHIHGSFEPEKGSNKKKSKQARSIPKDGPAGGGQPGSSSGGGGWNWS